ncbi:membrane integrity-associated transporter subunit PqiC [Pseudomonas sp. Irchel s3h17]|uniref:PqiC family protein n=1 Tax=Pseudomonas sp. Irchel s3h17 TaxID=2009182 RepID=UPI000BA43205|nr:PqiC family protein [Pseudomonas sp. Irchel s3h17]
MSLSLRVGLVGALLVLTACSSDPVHYHTLIPAQPASTTRSAASIQFEQVSVPAQVDRTQIVIRQGNSGLAVLETEWWGASLSEELQSALADQLSGTSNAHKMSLRVDVQRFDSIPGHYALLDTQWRLRNLDSDDTSTFLNCRTTVQTPSGATIDDLVLAHQKNVKGLAAAISQAAASGRCPGAR